MQLKIRLLGNPLVIQQIKGSKPASMKRSSQSGEILSHETMTLR
jgi:hypothetical protein